MPAVYEVTDLRRRDERCFFAVGGEDQCCARAGTEDDTGRDGMISISTFKGNPGKFMRAIILLFDQVHKCTL